MTRLRLAVIGAGRLGGFHAQKAAANGRINLVGVVDPIEASRKRLAKECQTESFESIDQLRGKIDAAVIATPTQYHHQVGMELLNQGIHLLVEKPLCPTTDEANQMVDAAEANRAVLQVGHVERFNPAFAAVRGSMADPKYISATRASGFTFRSTDIGVVLDLMIHDIDLVLSLVQSPVTQVEALGFSVMGGHEDVANARLHFESGCVATLNASRVSPEATRQMQIWSRSGWAKVDFGSLESTVVFPNDAIRERQFDIDSLSPEEIDHYREHFFEEALITKRHNSQGIDAIEQEQKDFFDSILTPRTPRVTGRQGRDAVAVAEQVLDAIESHAWDSQHRGPMAVPHPAVIPSHTWEDVPRREAG